MDLFSSGFFGGVLFGGASHSLQRCSGFDVVRTVLLDLGIASEPDDSEDDYSCWKLVHGSANLLVMLFRDHSQAGGEWVVQVSAVMVRLPDGSPSQLLSHCLAANMDLLDCYFALHHEADVVLTSKRRLQGLDNTGFRTMLISVAEQADRLDDLLAQQFNVQRWGHSI